MKTSLAALVLFVAAASLVAADVAFAKDRGGRSGGGGRSAQHSGKHHHHHHARSRAFVGAFAAGPVWPWWAYAVYAEPTGPVQYIERAEEGQGEWLYCSAANAYFPHVAECPGGWQGVRPPAPPG
jgi:hypothetical protein